MPFKTRVIPAVILAATRCLLCAPILQAAPVVTPPLYARCFCNQYKWLLATRLHRAMERLHTHWFSEPRGQGRL